MFKRDYYPLKKAAELLNCSEEDIIHRGATGELPVYILTSKFLIDSRRKEDEGMISQIPNGWHPVRDKPINQIAKLSKDCLAEFEAGYKLATPIIEPDTIFDTDGVPIELMYMLRHKNKPIPTFEAIEQARSLGIDIEKREYNPPITLKDCVMVVLADDLKVFGQRIKSSWKDDEALADTAKFIDTGKINSQLTVSGSKIQCDKALNLIKCMAIVWYGHNPNIAYKGGISEKLLKHGISVDDKDISKYLTEAESESVLENFSETEWNTMLKLMVGMTYDATGCVRPIVVKDPYTGRKIRNPLTGKKNGIIANLEKALTKINEKNKEDKGPEIILDVTYGTFSSYLTEAEKLINPQIQ